MHTRLPSEQAAGARSSFSATRSPSEALDNVGRTVTGHFTDITRAAAEASDSLIGGLAQRGTALAQRARKDLATAVAPLSLGWNAGSTAEALTGVIELEGSALHMLLDAELERVVQVAFQHVLVQSGFNKTSQVVCRIVECFRPPQHGVNDDPVNAVLHFSMRLESLDVLPVAAVLRREEENQGSFGMLPAIVDALESQDIRCGHLRIRISLDRPGRSQQRGSDADGIGGHSGAYGDEKGPRTRSPSPGHVVDIEFQRKSSSRASFQGRNSRTPSPTAANLARNPALLAKVMANAIPILDNSEADSIGIASSRWRGMHAGLGVRGAAEAVGQQQQDLQNPQLQLQMVRKDFGSLRPSTVPEALEDSPFATGVSLPEASPMRPSSGPRR
eukprot:TRINITY_DN10464_c0_g1_i12.p1 TRINITY_DN10464_c0_g1~~TRINITY_DN10464_c0_g1_i12.p1  ORF type:complete len:388 (-),score=72.68 TRINITY_DN10464_c0_g1_i12:54-1217(-)